MHDVYHLGPTVLSAWAKSDRDSRESMTLVQHCQDAAEVARRLWPTRVSRSARPEVERWFREQPDDGKPQNLADFVAKVAVFLAGAHDVGKFSPAFACQVPELAERMADAGLRFPSTVLSADERNKAHHTVISMMALQEWLEAKFPSSNLKRRRIQSISVILGGHHGKFPCEKKLSYGKSDTRGAGKPDDQGHDAWQQGRFELLDYIQTLSGLTDAELEWLARIGLDQPSQVILTAFVIECDWIASNADLFPYHDSLGASARTNSALNRLALPQPWVPRPPDSDETLFRSRFQLPPGATPRPVQRDALTVARSMAHPGLMIIEAATGEGKTEAALGAAEVLAAKFGCGGVMVALPTQATSNAMFSRTLKWLASASGNDITSIALTHGKSQFNDEFDSLTHLGIDKVYDGEKSTSGAVAHAWLSGRKKSILADFVVGTIDQVLMGALSAKHVVLRLYGLASKVVILDEIHAADIYMRAYLRMALTWLGALGVPVIALSATLPPAIRTELLTAYAEGASQSDHTAIHQAGSALAYPLITSTTGDPIASTASGRRTEAHVEYLPAGDDAIVATVTDLASDGGIIAVIRNTVAHAQETFSALSAQFGDDVVLVHSRFVATDRLALERDLVDALGPDGERPKRLIVVATQVIEQSLDVDFDAIVTDVAPLDSIIQRMGRLHRHARPADARPAKLSRPSLYIAGVERIAGIAPTFDGGSVRVYGADLLLRTVATLDEHLTHRPTIISPDDVAPLVRRAYTPNLTPPAGWEKEWKIAMEERLKTDSNKKERAESGTVSAPRKGPRPLIGWAPIDSADAAKSETVRDIRESLEVIMVVRAPDGSIRTLPWLDDRPDEQVNFTLGLDHELAKTVAKCTVNLPPWFVDSCGDKLITELEHDGVRGWQESPWLKGELPLVLNADLTRDICGHRLRYDRLIGLTIEKGDK